MEETKLFDIDISEFNDYIDNERLILIKNNKEYKELQTQYYSIMEKYPNLQ